MNNKRESEALESKIIKTFVKGEVSSVGDKLNLVGDYVNGKPKYINEVKMFLYENDKELYKKYGECFIDNLGVKKVFGLEPKPKERIEIIRVPSLKPVIKSKGHKNDNLKKKLKKANKMETREKLRETHNRKKEYEKKLKGIQDRIKKSK